MFASSWNSRLRNPFKIGPTWKRKKIGIKIGKKIHSIESQFSSSERMKRLNKIYILSYYGVVVCISCFFRQPLMICPPIEPHNSIIHTFVAKHFFLSPPNRILFSAPRALMRAFNCCLLALWMCSDCHGFSLHANMSRHITPAFNQHIAAMAAIS